MLNKRGQSYLTTGDGHDPFLPKLLSAVNEASEIDLAVAFVKATGLALLFDPLRDALIAGARLRILTGDYLCVTDAEALRTLLILKEEGADVRVFRSDGKSFHMKAYIFVENCPGGSGGHAFVGSSNISQSALQHGLEWNLRVEESENPAHFREIREKFEALFQHKKSEMLTNDWIEEYNARVLSVRSIPIEEPGADEFLPPPEPNDVQAEALKLLEETRLKGNTRGLVVLATGMGKTWLAAFDAQAMNAKRILFVAHREEILTQAEETFVRIRPTSSVGKYTGRHQELNVDTLFASVQTLGKARHLEKFRRDYFDYIVVDEFHHAAARTYRQLLSHFLPRFLLGLTATPDRTDQSDILGLCDNNLVICRDLFRGVESQILCPFHYFGIGDETVDYSNIPWRSGRFDPSSLDAALATVGRARHILKSWRSMKRTRTLAFCSSQSHADYMTDYFLRNGERAVSVHSNSAMRRTGALDMLREGDIDIIFSVDLFNEGVDVPCIDTVLMIRPTESKIIFLQQLGRGLRRSPETEKTHLVILDFIGNHISFFRKAEALFSLGRSNKERRDFLDSIELETLKLPNGCYVNFDLKAIEFLTALAQTRVDSQIEIYQSLTVSLGARPTMSQFYSAGGALKTVRREFGGWFQFVRDQRDLTPEEESCVEMYGVHFESVELAQPNSLFKFALLEAFLENDGVGSPVSRADLAKCSYEIATARKTLCAEIPNEFSGPNQDFDLVASLWETYWDEMFLAPWREENARQRQSCLVVREDGALSLSSEIDISLQNVMADLLLELSDCKYSQVVESRKVAPVVASVVQDDRVEVPYFPDLRIACGHFASSTHDETLLEYCALPRHYGKLDSSRHFVATARGNSMSGGKKPIKDGDFLLLELITPKNAGSISDQVVAIERQDVTGDDQYLLRYVKKNGPNDYTLKAWNPDYEDITATEDMRTFARLCDVIEPLDFHIHRPIMREEIPRLFGLEFNTGLWQSGHVPLGEVGHHVLLVTLNKQGKNSDHRYHDYFVTPALFHWQSQRTTTPSMKRGKTIIDHEKENVKIHLFVRRNKLEFGKGAPFFYCGTLRYQKHNGAAPMNVFWELDTPLSGDLVDVFGVIGDGVVS